MWYNRIDPEKPLLETPGPAWQGLRVGGHSTLERWHTIVLKIYGEMIILVYSFFLLRKCPTSFHRKPASLSDSLFGRDKHYKQTVQSTRKMPPEKQTTYTQLSDK